MRCIITLEADGHDYEVAVEADRGVPKASIIHVATTAMNDLVTRQRDTASPPP